VELSAKIEKEADEFYNVLDRLLVIGSTGLVGSKLCARALAHGFEVYATQNSRHSLIPNAAKLDITNRTSTLNLINDVRPQVIVNTAALTNVDYCEDHRDEAERVNVGGLRNIVDGSLLSKSRLVHISTDSVFDGTKGHYTESDSPNPINYYSETKLESEKIVTQLPNYAIARPSVVFGWAAPTKGEPAISTKTLNFAMFLLHKLSQGETISAVTDQYSSPTFSDNLADVLLRLARFRDNGIFHTAGKTCLSRYAFATKIAQVFGYATSLIQPVTTDQFRQLARRPKNSCLSVEKTERALGPSLLSAEEGIVQMRNQQEYAEYMPS